MKNSRKEKFQKIAANAKFRRFLDLPAESQTSKVITRVVEKAIGYAIRHSSSDEEFELLLDEGIDFVDYMQRVLNPLVNTSDKCLQEYYQKFLSGDEKSEHPKSWVWKHRDVEAAFLIGKESGHYWPINNDELSEVCYLYLSIPWINCGLIDKMLVDAMIYSETLGFGESIKPALLKRDIEILNYTEIDNIVNGKSRIVGKLVKLFLLGMFLVGLPGLVGSVAVTVDGWYLGLWYGFSLWALLSICYYVKSLIKNESQSKALKSIADKLSDMQYLSRTMNKYPLSAKYIRERLYDLSKEGVVWQVGVFPILDAAIARKEKLWD